MPALETGSLPDYLRPVVESAPYGIAVIEQQGPVRFVNEAFAALHGYGAAGDLLGTPWPELFDDGSSTRLEERLDSPASSVTVTGVTVSAESDREGPVVIDYDIRTVEPYYVWYARESRSDRQAEVDRYEIILENIHDAVYTLDASGRITWVNEVAVEEHDIGYSRDDLIGAPVSKVLSDDDINKCIDLIEGLLDDDDRDSARCRIDIRTAYGDTIPCDLHLGLLPGDDDEGFPGTVGVLRDISERQRREQRLTVLNRVLRHNLRNDLNVISGRATVLERELDDPALIQSVEKIRSTVQELATLSDKARTIEDSLAREDRRGEPVSLAAVAEDRVATLRQRFPDASIELTVGESVWVMADAMLGTVLDNLVENAVLHHDGTGPSVAVSVGPDEDRGEEWGVLSVVDDGPGIPADERDPVETGRETDLHHGSGLGLWLCKWLVEGYGGDFAIRDRTPRGTTVEVRLPRARPTVDVT